MTCIAINGYGAGRDAAHDPQYDRYLGAILPRLAALAPGETVYLLGGATNDARMSEAQYMRDWFHVHARHLPCVFKLVEPQSPTRGAWDNVRHLYVQIGDVPVDLYCLKERAPKMQFLLSRRFKNARAIGVDFARFRGSEDWLVARAAWAVYDTIDVLSHLLPGFSALRDTLRMRHVRNARADHDASLKRARL